MVRTPYFGVFFAANKLAPKITALRVMLVFTLEKVVLRQKFQICMVDLACIDTCIDEIGNTFFSNHLENFAVILVHIFLGVSPCAIFLLSRHLCKFQFMPKVV